VSIAANWNCSTREETGAQLDTGIRRRFLPVLKGILITTCGKARVFTPLPTIASKLASADQPSHSSLPATL